MGTHCGEILMQCGLYVKRRHPQIPSKLDENSPSCCHMMECQRHRTCACLSSWCANGAYGASWHRRGLADCKLQKSSTHCLAHPRLQEVLLSAMQRTLCAKMHTPTATSGKNKWANACRTTYHNVAKSCVWTQEFFLIFGGGSKYSVDHENSRQYPQILEETFKAFSFVYAHLLQIKYCADFWNVLRKGTGGRFLLCWLAGSLPSIFFFLVFFQSHSHPLAHSFSLSLFFCK